MAVMIYALYTYHWRAASIRRGGRGPYDDRFGKRPIALKHYTSPDEGSSPHRANDIMHSTTE